MKVRIRLTEPMLGTVPKDKEIYASYIESRRPANGATDNETETVQEIEEKGWTGFHTDEGGLFIYDYMIRGFLKHWGNVLKDELKVKALRSKIDDRVFIFPRRLHLGKDKPDGVLERPLRAMTARGERVSLARSDYVAAGAEIEFEVRIVGSEITETMIRELLGYGTMMGLGQFRNGSYGRFEVVSATSTGHTAE